MDYKNQTPQSRTNPHLLFALVLGCSLFTAYLLIQYLLSKGDETPTPKAEMVDNGVEFSYQKPDGSKIFVELPSTKKPPVNHLQAIDELATKNSTHQLPPEETASFEPPETQKAIGARTVSSVVKKGDSLFKIFSQLGLAHSTLDKIVSTYDSPASPLKYIYPGQTINFEIEPESNALVSFSFNKDRLTKVIISRDEHGNFSVEESSRTVAIDVAFAQGTIEQAFYVSAKKSNLSDKTIMAFADIFAWDVDFTLDIRKGDHFEVVYERNHLEDGTTEEGQILTAKFTNRNETFSAIAFTAPDGTTSYYTLDGLNIRKAFLRSPVDFARISSHFNLERRHPVLHTIRAHKGVDYAAKRGTPVKATGDGKVNFIGRKGGYGRVVILQHGQKYSTLYAHLQGYAKNLKTGSSVRQGQVVGYIGSSGLATGPHLHYEFRVNNVHKNPLTVKFPDADPIPEKYRKTFNKTKADRLAQLDSLKSETKLARKEE